MSLKVFHTYESTYNSATSFTDLQNDHGIESGNTYVLTHSKLGAETKLYDEYNRWHGATYHYWIPSGSLPSSSSVRSLMSHMQNSVRTLKPAHVRDVIVYHSHYVPYIADDWLSGSYDSEYFSYDNQSLYITQETDGDGKNYISPVINLGTDCSIYNWYYDWCWELFNNASGAVFVRQGVDSASVGDNPFSLTQLNDINPSGSVEQYQQFKITAYASGSEDFRIHQFTYKAREAQDPMAIRL